MFRLFPYISFDFIVADPPAVVAARIAACTKPDNWFLRFFWGSPFASSDRFPFIGDVWDSGFRVRRNIDYRNALRPELNGQFKETAGGTQIHVHLSIRWRDARAIAVAMAITAGIGLAALFGMLRSRHWNWLVVLVFLGMPLLWWAMIQGCFWIDAPTSRQLITQVLSGSNELRHVGS